MEIREPLSQGECVPMQEWQTTYHPSCNGMHEVALDHMGTNNNLSGDDFTLFGTKGFWRNAWKVDVLGGKQLAKERETIVLKTLKFQHNFEDAHFEHDRIDAVAMERLTSSPHVINVFGFCGHSVMTEYADGTRVGELADKSKKKPLVRLQIARDIATGLADVHGIDGDGNTTFVHLDINPANVMSIGGTLKLNDFNIGILLRWNTTSNTQCGFPAQYPNPQWRSPEEARNEQNLTEKVDVFSMGHIFFRLICGHEPWNKLEPGGRPSKEEVNEKVQRGELPFIPDHIRHTDNEEVAVIRDAMLRCYAFDPTQRPSARDIANSLESALGELTAKQQEAAKAATSSKHTTHTHTHKHTHTQRED
uniref:Protein kinase domain-containing protein n=1 Tax=Cyclophora tenuis TaxID=216820 RepID=A0A7S1D763_CYCTE